MDDAGLTSWAPCQPDHLPDRWDGSPFLARDDPAAENDPDQKQNVSHKVSQLEPLRQTKAQYQFGQFCADGGGLRAAIDVLLGGNATSAFNKSSQWVGFSSHRTSCSWDDTPGCRAYPE